MHVKSSFLSVNTQCFFFYKVYKIIAALALLTILHNSIFLVHIFILCCRGLWNVPFINNCYLVNMTIFQKHDRSKIKFVRDNLDADMALCANLRDLDVFLYVSNREDFGHLINPDTYDITMVHPDMYQIFENGKDWEERYIHPEYKDNFLPEKKPTQVQIDSKLINLLKNS